MLANVWVWVGLSTLGIVWFSVSLSVVAAVVVGGRAEKRTRGIEGSERTGRASSAPDGSLADRDAVVIEQTAKGLVPGRRKDRRAGQVLFWAIMHQHRRGSIPRTSR
jgi:hypothetical protein